MSNEPGSGREGTGDESADTAATDTPTQTPRKPLRERARDKAPRMLWSEWYTNPLVLLLTLAFAYSTTRTVFMSTHIAGEDAAAAIVTILVAFVFHAVVVNGTMEEFGGVPGVWTGRNNASESQVTLFCEDEGPEEHGHLRENAIATEHTKPVAVSEIEGGTRATYECSRCGSYHQYLWGPPTPLYVGDTFMRGSSGSGESGPTGGSGDRAARDGGAPPEDEDSNDSYA